MNAIIPVCECVCVLFHSRVGPEDNLLTSRGLHSVYYSTRYFGANIGEVWVIAQLISARISHDYSTSPTRPAFLITPHYSLNPIIL